MPERAAALFVFVMTVAAAAFVATRPTRPAEPERVEPPPAPRRVRLEARVLDEGNVPVPDASVLLYGQASAWLDGRERCDVSLLLCEDFDAGLEVLRRLDAGTLAYPEPLQRTTTDADGRFVFADVPDDTFVIAHGEQWTLERVEDGGVADLRFDLDARKGREFVTADGDFGPELPVVLVNPFVRDWASLVTDEGGADFTWDLPHQVWVISTRETGVSSVGLPSGRDTLHVGTPAPFVLRLEVDAGVLAPGEVRLRCDGFERRAFFDGGAEVRFEQVMGQCHASGRLGDYELEEHEVLRTEGGEALAKLDARASLELELSAPLEHAGVVVAGPSSANVFAMFSRDWQRESIAAGERVVKFATLPAGARSVTIRARGVKPLETDLVLAPGHNRFQLAVTRSLVARGVVRGVDGGPLVDAPVDVFHDVDGTPLGSTETDEQGRFDFDLVEDAPVRMVVSSERYGVAVLEGADPSKPLMLTVPAATRTLRVRTLGVDGGVLPGDVRASGDAEAPPVSLTLGKLAKGATMPRPVFLDGHHLWRDDAGVSWWLAPAAGAHRVTAQAPGFSERSQEIVLPDAGVVTIDLVLAPAVTLQAVAVFHGQPVSGLVVRIGEGDDARYATTNSRGLFRFEGLSPGPHHLKLSTEFGERSHEVDVVAPTLDARIDLPD